MEERLQKIIANSGKASRRHAEEMILEGRVRVNGKLVRELGSRADPDKDRIELDGEAIWQPDKVYYALHKPPLYITSLEDPQGRPHIGELILRIRERVVPVGRLDWESEGLLVLTNDGEAVYRMTHPKYGVKKTYHVKVKGVPTEEQISLLRRGVTIDERRTGTNEVEWMRNTRGDINSWWRVTINEGINRQVRKMFDRIEHPVQKLIRVREGEIDLGTLPRGAYRELNAAERRYIDSIGKQTIKAERPGADGKPRGPKKPPRKGGFAPKASKRRTRLAPVRQKSKKRD
jgi:23S rRNA pseudouridine2605 synthase